MPCRDYYDDHPEEYYADTIKYLRKQVSFAESALCATLAALEHTNDEGSVAPDFYDSIDYKAAGITKKELQVWHKKHKDLDAIKKEQQKSLKDQALAKLTKEERKVLGL